MTLGQRELLRRCFDQGMSRERAVRVTGLSYSNVCLHYTAFRRGFETSQDYAKFLGELRKHKKRVEILAALDENNFRSGIKIKGYVLPIQESIQHSEIRETVQHALKEFSEDFPRYARILQSIFLEDKTVIETASELNIPPRTCYDNQQRALRYFRPYLEDRL